MIEAISHARSEEIARSARQATAIVAAVRECLAWQIDTFRDDPSGTTFLSGEVEFDLLMGPIQRVLLADPRTVRSDDA